jgi:hypothetical protein
MPWLIPWIKSTWRHERDCKDCGRRLIENFFATDLHGSARIATRIVTQPGAEGSLPVATCYASRNSPHHRLALARSGKHRTAM